MPFLTSIDTLPLAQALMPFSPSYALEVLERSLDKKHIEKTDIEGTNHDALYDAYATQRVFLECIARLAQTYKQFPQIQRYLSRSDSSLAKTLHFPA